MTTPDNPPEPLLSGVLVIDKPAGWTSMDVVAHVRRRAGGVRTGHAGTLDPLATGVLVLALGRATRLIDRLMATDKRYRSRIDLGAFTATDDAEAPREEVEVTQPPDAGDILAALERFTGTFLQRPPAHSAVKIRGRRAYQLARSGRPARPAARPATMHDIRLLHYEWPFVEIDIHCGKGLYVRSLARDLGLALGTGGYCVSIRRTAVGPFTIDHARPLEQSPATIVGSDLVAVKEALAMVEEEEGDSHLFRQR